MSPNVIIRRNISFVGCILIIAATELNKISRSLFIALQCRRRCISSSILFDSHPVHIRWFIGVIRSLYRPLSISKSCELMCKYFNNWIFKGKHKIICITNMLCSPCSLARLVQRTERIREHQFVNRVPSNSSSILYAFLTGWLCDRSRILHQYFKALIWCRIINGKRPVSPYIAGVDVCYLTPRVDLINYRCIFSKSYTIPGIPYITCIL